MSRRWGLSALLVAVRGMIGLAGCSRRVPEEYQQQVVRRPENLMLLATKGPNLDLHAAIHVTTSSWEMIDLGRVEITKLDSATGEVTINFTTTQSDITWTKACVSREAGRQTCERYQNYHRQDVTTTLYPSTTPAPTDWSKATIYISVFGYAPGLGN